MSSKANHLFWNVNQPETKIGHRTAKQIEQQMKQNNYRFGESDINISILSLPRQSPVRTSLAFCRQSPRAIPNNMMPTQFCNNIIFHPFYYNKIRTQCATNSRPWIVIPLLLQTDSQTDSQGLTTLPLSYIYQRPESAAPVIIRTIKAQNKVFAFLNSPPTLCLQSVQINRSRVWGCVASPTIYTAFPTTSPTKISQLNGSAPQFSMPFVRSLTHAAATDRSGWLTLHYVCRWSEQTADLLHNFPFNVTAQGV